MEEHLSYNWNVYKLFNNGNRAKAPFAVIESGDCESENFCAVVHPVLGTPRSDLLHSCNWTP